MFSTFLNFKSYAETQFSTSLQVLQTDNGTEFANNQMHDYLIANGILHHLTCPYTPEQNGVAERKHQHITEIAIALLHQSSVPLQFWFEAMATAVSH